MAEIHQPKGIFNVFWQGNSFKKNRKGQEKITTYFSNKRFKSTI
ncbi:hypothetical protein CWATWH0402_5478 [Crocosphaera watsonii WH 0402]|uniref:Uncharacterized protein n=1 Tax=Crocosphaera watsonii WH 0402 TaxID=1284629 RepID=T2JWB8_CROWT|nr:hypothetical protein CWATWH0402_5478 [Crocosphaera watsonii WH 0402]